MIDVEDQGNNGKPWRTIVLKIIVSTVLLERMQIPECSVRMAKSNLSTSSSASLLATDLGARHDRVLS